MLEQRISLDAGATTFRAVRQTRRVLMPHTVDQTGLAAGFRARNEGKSYEVYEFRGIPYATSPAGWWGDITQAALPSGAFDATTYKSVWPTTNIPSWPTDIGWRPNDGARRGVAELDEWGVVERGDFLLDICTPNPRSGADLPVIVNVHGGSNYLNARTFPRFSGRGIARKGVVHVNLTVPLGSWGFFDHPAFGEGWQANRMYQAILVALEWVQDNIHWFGGNPASVTGTGTSAGGQAWTHLMPMGGSLFHRIQAHSGGDISGRITRETVRSLGQVFLATLVKGVPAHWDPSRTIQQVLDEDGEAAALRLGPGKEQIHQFMGQRTAWTLDGGALVRSTASLVNVWPVRDGTIIQHQTVRETIAADRWPLGVQAWFTHVRDESSVFGGMRDAENSDDILRRVGITDPAEIAAIEAMVEAPDDHTPRILAGEVIFRLPAWLQCKLFSEKGGVAYNTDFNFDSLGNGRRTPTHASQQVTFTGLPEWQVAMGSREPSLRITASDYLASEVCASALAAYAATGDPAADYTSQWDIDLFPQDVLREVGEFAPFGEDRVTSVFDNKPTDPDYPNVENVPFFGNALYEALSANI